MTPKRMAYLKQHCHDSIVRIETSIKCGKLIPDLQTVANLYEVLEEILQHVEQRSIGFPEDA